ncbi:MAG TPA: hypothetical protein VEY67_01215, partial [Candidatus Dormibacteraeota bacterium]|nr:hypothetical protein [Candidatus Dormibacteraeota bacterium]
MATTERPGHEERELARRLEAYAQARLRPDPVAMARMRSALVARARVEGAAPVDRAASGASGAVPHGGVTPFRRRRVSRFATALLAAAALVAIVVGSAAASQAGAPLYGARLWVETITLPTSPDARADAQLARLDARISELRAALAAHDDGAASAALDAYRSILDDTMGDALDSGPSLERIETAISKHLDVLRGLLATAPAQARDGLERAIERSDNGLQRLHERSAGEPGNRPSSPPGQATTPPGQATTPPGQSGKESTPPGQASTPPGQASTPPGQASTPPGQASTP